MTVRTALLVVLLIFGVNMVVHENLYVDAVGGGLLALYVLISRWENR